ncbi:hypothetical protein [Melittangium boletus]|nr:hypothetical protein [Melittangium boletus]
MSKKDVLHIPLTPTPPQREAGSEEDEHPGHEAPVMNPDTGPGGTPGLGGKTHVIKPVPSPGRYPGVSVT